ncbi:MAG: SOS response-associated peptidase family protein [Bacteroidota bacterium]
MCYHKELKATPKQLKERFTAKFPLEELFEPQEFINGFNHPLCPVITNEDSSTIQLFRWGLIPNFELNIQRGNTLNAIYETLLEKISYRNYTTQRCIVPATGIYEWRQVGKYKEKKKYYIADQPIFSMAGLWNRCTDPSTGKQFESYTIITKNGTAAILNDEAAWLQEGELLINSNEAIAHLTPPQLGLF